MICRATSDAARLQAVTWLAGRLGVTTRDLVWTHPHEALAVIREGRIVGVILYIHHRGRSVEAHWAGEPGWLTKDALAGMFSFPFHGLGVHRLVGLIPKSNKTARQIAERLGFVIEGVLKEAEDDGEDLVIYRMFKRDCRWLGNDGQKIGTEVRRRGSNKRADAGQSGVDGGQCEGREQDQPIRFVHHAG